MVAYCVVPGSPEPNCGEANRPRTTSFGKRCRSPEWGAKQPARSFPAGAFFDSDEGRPEFFR